MTTVKSTLARAVAYVAMTGGALAATVPAENTSPYVMSVLGQEVLMASKKRATGAPFTDTVAGVTLAPHVEVASDGTVNPSCVASGVALRFEFTNSDGKVTHPARYNSGYVSIDHGDAVINEALFQAGFVANNPSLTSNGQVIDVVSGGTMPNGVEISGYMIQPANDGAYQAFQNVMKSGKEVTLRVTSPLDNTLDANYDFAAASQASADCQAFLNDPDAIAKLTEKASNKVTVDTEKVSTDELIASGYETVEAQREFKRSLMGQSCNARDFGDIQLDDVNIVRVILETGKKSTSRFGIEYVEDGKTITAIGDYYKRVVHPNGKVEESFSPSTDDPSITSCAGTVTATNGDEMIVSLLEPTPSGQGFGGVYKGPFIGGNARGFGSGTGGGGGGSVSSSRGGDEITNIFCSNVGSDFSNAVLSGNNCNDVNVVIDKDIIGKDPHKPHDVAPIPISPSGLMLSSGLAAAVLLARRRRPKGLAA